MAAECGEAFREDPLDCDRICARPYSTPADTQQNSCEWLKVIDCVCIWFKYGTSNDKNMASTKGDGQKKGAGKGTNNNVKQTPGKALLSVRYPVNSTWEFTLPNEEIAAGTVYCTDETSQIVVLQKALTHTTLTFEVRMVQVASIKKEKLISSSTENSNNTDATLSKPLPVVQKKALEEREKRAVRLAEESFRHINQNVSALIRCSNAKFFDLFCSFLTSWHRFVSSFQATPEGQAIFDRLLKACNEVVWDGESIIVLHQIQVDPPYKQENCTIISGGSGAGGSLDRIKKIVASAAGGSY